MDLAMSLEITDMLRAAGLPVDSLDNPSALIGKTYLFTVVCGEDMEERAFCAGTIRGYAIKKDDPFSCNFRGYWKRGCKCIS